ncbi:LCP family protein [Thalassobacillus pellis]|uniref:LCP family glycopolymer transferase n=1 Tax=Thalassobacillus pellis TaxID=748008 RepID=UPI001961AA22|nr:LCP family protein [Thalassobacillus pellis]MBM7551704.1 LCP family protein required for cell wall assembly [Thalassobacillus pellis]
MKRKVLVKRKRRKRLLRRIVTVFVLALLIITGGFTYLYYQTSQAADQSYNDLNREKSKLRQDTVSISNDPVSFLLLGVEDYATSGANGRADTIMVATFNQTKETMKLVSIPRDTLVTIAGKGTEDKINHSYAFGGAKMTIETVEQFLDIPIDYYATINFEGFENIVDIAGGIPVEVPFDFTEKNADDSEILHYYEGPMVLNGEEALGYARMRKQDPRGDLGRADRQKQVLKSLIDELTKPSSVMKVDELTEEVGKNVTTNLKISEMLAFYKQYKDFNVDNIEQLTLEGEGIRLNGRYYYNIFDSSLAEIQHTLRSHLEIESTKETSYNNDSYEDSNY